MMSFQRLILRYNISVCISGWGESTMDWQATSSALPQCSTSISASQRIMVRATAADRQAPTRLTSSRPVLRIFLHVLHSPTACTPDLLPGQLDLVFYKPRWFNTSTYSTVAGRNYGMHGYHTRNYQILRNTELHVPTSKPANCKQFEQSLDTYEWQVPLCRGIEKHHWYGKLPGIIRCERMVNGVKWSNL